MIHRPLTMVDCAFAFSLCVTVIGCEGEKEKGGSGSAELTTSDTRALGIRVGYMPYTSDLAIFVAREKGYFREEGIEPDFTEFRSTTDNLNALKAGRIDAVGIIGTPTLLSFEASTQGFLGVFLPAIETAEHFSATILVRSDSPYRDLSDLRGRTIGTYTGTTQFINLQYVLQQAGFSEGEISIRQVSSELQLHALASGQFEALFTIEPYGTMATAKGIGKVLVENPRCRFIRNPFPASAQAVSRSFVASNPEAFRRYYFALRKSVEYIRQNHGEALGLLPKYTALSQEMAVTSRTYYWIFDEEIDLDAFQAIADLYHERGLVTRELDVRSMFLAPESTSAQ